MSFPDQRRIGVDVFTPQMASAAAVREALRRAEEAAEEAEGYAGSADRASQIAEEHRDTARQYRDETEQRYVPLGDVSGTVDLTDSIADSPAALDFTLTGDTTLALPDLGDRVLTCSLWVAQDTTGEHALTVEGAHTAWAEPVRVTPDAEAVDLIHLLHYGPRGWVALTGAQMLGVPQ